MPQLLLLLKVSLHMYILIPICQTSTSRVFLTSACKLSSGPFKEALTEHSVHCLCKQQLQDPFRGYGSPQCLFQEHAKHHSELEQTAFLSLCSFYNITVIFSAPEQRWSVVQVSGVTTEKSHSRGCIDEL